MKNTYPKRLSSSGIRQWVWEWITRHSAPQFNSNIINFTAILKINYVSDWCRGLTNKPRGEKSRSWLQNVRLSCFKMIQQYWKTVGLVSFIGFLCYINSLEGEFVFDDRWESTACKSLPFVSRSGSALALAALPHERTSSETNKIYIRRNV